MQKLREGHAVVEAANIPELHQKQEYGGCILKSRHNRLRREFDERAQSDETEKSFKNSPQQNDRKYNGKIIAVPPDLMAGISGCTHP